MEKATYSGYQCITCRKFTAEEKIRIVLKGFRREILIRNLCRLEGIKHITYYAWLIT